MPVLRPDPHPCDLDAWKQRLRELEADPSDPWRDNQIEMTKVQIAAIEEALQKSPVEAR